MYSNAFIAHRTYIQLNNQFFFKNFLKKYPMKKNLYL